MLNYDALNPSPKPSTLLSGLILKQDVTAARASKAHPKLSVQPAGACAESSALLSFFKILFLGFLVCSFRVHRLYRALWGFYKASDGVPGYKGALEFYIRVLCSAKSSQTINSAVVPWATQGLIRI